ncbi:MAG: YhcH/YjgK/YiaL family protein [Anaerolineae bacterium]
MIIDLLVNAPQYEGLSPRIRQAFDFLQQTDLAALALGIHEIDGRALYASVQTFSTHPLAEGGWEAHRRYLDLHYVIEGAERIGYAPAGSLSPGAYDAENDFMLLSGEAGALVPVPSGAFMLLWPNEAHMPGLAVDEPAMLRKVVVKIAA